MRTSQPATRGKPGSIDMFIVVAVFLILSGPQFAPTDDIARQLVVVGIGFLLLWFRWGQSHRGGGAAYASLLLFVAFAFASQLWSDDPGRTASGSVLGLAAVLFGSYAGRILKGDQVLNVIAIMAASAALLSIIAAVVSPVYALVGDGYLAGQLRGIYIHRNHLGYVATLGIVASVAGLIFIKGRRSLYLGVFALFVFTLWRVSSATAFLVSLVSISLLLVVRLLSRIDARYRAIWLLVYALLVGAASLLILTSRSGIFAMFGRDGTLTGRTDIWAVTLEAWSQHPWIGHGWGAVWGESDLLQSWISSMLNFRVYHAHNGYIDVLIQVGLVGLLLLVFALITIVNAGVRELLQNDAPMVTSIFALALVVAISAYSIAESRISAVLSLAIIGYLSAALWRPTPSDVSDLNGRVGSRANRKIEDKG